MKNKLGILIFLSALAPLFGGTFEQGKEFFLNDQPAEAAVYFEKALSEEPGNENVYMYLGLSYIQNGLAEKAVTIFVKGAELKGTQEGRFYLNAGNAYFSVGRIDDALFMYNHVIEESFPEKGQAMLNRANISMKREDFAGAVDLYREYLESDPASGQKDKILQLIALIENRMAQEAAEAERLAAEAERLRLEEEKRQADAAAEAERLRLEEEKRLAEAAAEAERLRLAEELRKAEEAARQQALMDEILSSLSTIGEETQNISAESETINQTDEDSDIDD
ncbi:MAG: tetratricopeptide repeat protein [Spirochaetales bacterium]|nr:tetratricopeptide repeat protein [Spirochaetales bacterium]